LLLGAARLRAARLSEQVAATVPVELNRTYHGQFEEQLGDLRAEVARRLGTLSQAERRRVAQALAIDALEGFGAEAVVITLRGDDQAVFGDALAASLREKTGRTAETLIVGPSDRDGEAGPVLRSVDGRRTWDNRVSVRLARLWPELRRQLAVHLPGAAVSAAELASLCTLPGPEEGA